MRLVHTFVVSVAVLLPVRIVLGDSEGELLTPPAPSPVAGWGEYGMEEPVMVPPEAMSLQDGNLSLWDHSGHWFDALGLRHSSVHGRSTGQGIPLRGTSWLNRPYEMSFDVGALVMTGAPAEGTRRNNDLFAAYHLGWDWDHYWGTQFRFGWATPDISDSALASDGNDLFITDLSLLYYPWGDSRLRPYYRVGLGLTDLKFTDTTGTRQHETLLTIPLGIGIKYQTHRWLAFHAEFVDNIALGQNDVSTMNNLTFLFGFEWRFGGPPENAWGFYHH